MILRSRAPTRLSFAGGGTDVSPYCDDYGGCVLSATVNKYAYSILESRTDTEIHLESGDFLKKLAFAGMNDLNYNDEMDLLKAAIKRMNTRKIGMNLFMQVDVPPGSGLGGSGAAFVSLVGLFNALNGSRMTKYEIADLALRIEREELLVPGGKQDQYASVFGGINYIEFVNGMVRVNPLELGRNTELELEEHLQLVYVGERKNSGSEIQKNIITEQSKSVSEQSKTVLDAFHKSKELVQEMRDCLRESDLMRFGELMHKGWEYKKRFSPLVSNDKIDSIYEIARKNGAIGGKLTGAGAGGYLLLFCEPRHERKLGAELKKIGLDMNPVTFDREGLKTWEAHPMAGVL